jgi:hypothetical protein
MNQILHIFKKDVRRHWPEILISFAFLGLYVWLTLRSPVRSSSTGISFGLAPWFSVEWIPPLMVVFWIFLVVRLVQGESLVGDRQWWVTKPYDWWKLFIAKQLFFITFVMLPLFCVQLFLLRHTGFPVLSNLGGVLSMQLSLAEGLLFVGIALGCLTKNLWQAALASVAIIVASIILSSVEAKIPNYNMSSSVGRWWGVSALEFVAAVMVIGALALQFARRRTWQARGLLLAGLFLSFASPAVKPTLKLIERDFPFVDSGSAPIHFTLAPIQPVEIPERFRYPASFSDDVSIGIPLTASGIAPGHLINIDGFRTYIQSASGSKLDLNWQRHGGVEWPDQASGLMFSIKRKDFEKWKAQPVSLQFELAISELEETNSRELALTAATFADKTLGFCRLNEQNPAEIDCAQAFAQPAFTATFDPSSGQCEIPEKEKKFFENRLSHAEWLYFYRSAFLNPVENYQISFGSGGWSWYGYSSDSIPKRIYLCPGAKIRLATPVERQQVRVKLQFDNIRLQDYVDKRFGED